MRVIAPRLSEARITVGEHALEQANPVKAVKDQPAGGRTTWWHEESSATRSSQL